MKGEYNGRKVLKKLTYGTVAVLSLLVLIVLVNSDWGTIIF